MNPIIKQVIPTFSPETMAPERKKSDEPIEPQDEEPLQPQEHKLIAFDRFEPEHAANPDTHQINVYTIEQLISDDGIAALMAEAQKKDAN